MTSTRPSSLCDPSTKHPRMNKRSVLKANSHIKNMQRIEIKNWQVITERYHTKLADVPTVNRLMRCSTEIHLSIHIGSVSCRHLIPSGLWRWNLGTQRFNACSVRMGYLCRARRTTRASPVGVGPDSTDYFEYRLDIISAGLTQRAELLNLILTDLYGNGL